MDHRKLQFQNNHESSFMSNAPSSIHNNSSEIESSHKYYENVENRLDHDMSKAPSQGENLSYWPQPPKIRSRTPSQYPIPTTLTPQEGTLSMSEIMEQENDDQLSSLINKVGSLKMIAKGIKRSINESDEVLDPMAPQIMNVNTLVGSTLKSFKGLLTSGGSGHMWILYIFLLVFFVFMYIFLKISSQFY